MLSANAHLFQRDKTALDTCEDLGHGEWLRHESLNLPCTLDGKLVLLGQLIHAHYSNQSAADLTLHHVLTDSNDILEGFVSLENLLCAGSNVVVALITISPAP